MFQGKFWDGMGILYCDLLVIGGGCGSVGRAKILANCISCSAKAIFTGFVGGEESVLPLSPRFFLVSFLFPGVRDSGETIGCQDGLGCYGEQHVV